MIDIYVDGACSQRNNSGRGKGGWAYIVGLADNKEKIGCGREAWTTNNRMELTAVIEALSLFLAGKKLESYSNEKLVVWSDSAYVVNCFKDKWYVSWIKTDFRNNTIANRDLWEKLLALVEAFDVEFRKVKGHSNNRLNNRCDKLAVEQTKK